MKPKKKAAKKVASKKKKPRKVVRDTTTGQFTEADQAQKDPKGTVTERIK
jgi:hypothetical protein